jgi:mannitol/fructose-specific phosphotransferase system IIA component (Ntr-type)
VNLGTLVDARDIVVGLQARDVIDAAAQLLRPALARRGFDEKEIQRLLDIVAHRELELPTACGEAAIPHARDPRLSSFVVAIGTNDKGVLEGAAQPRVIFTFLSPEPRRSEHLELLASLSRLACAPAAIDALAKARSGDEAAALLQRQPVGVVLVRE